MTTCWARTPRTAQIGAAPIRQRACSTSLSCSSAILRLSPKLGLLTGVLVLPQRQTPLVAKQAAEVDVLSGGKLRLGVGLGWNYVEYDALGEDFKTRAQRVEEQVAVLRKLW